MAAVGIGRFAYGADSANVPDLILVLLGFGIFIIASRLEGRRASETPESYPPAEGKFRTSGLAWTLLFSLVAILAAALALLGR